MNNLTHAKKKLFLIFVAAATFMLTIAGCAKSNESDGGGNAPKNTTQAPEATEQGEKATYPISGGVKLKFWLPLAANTSANFQNLAETEFAKALKERTGVEVEFIHPTAGTENEQFNLMVASGDLPDIIWHNWATYPGGPEKAISDQVIAKLNDLQLEHAPNLSKYLQENPDIDKMVKTDAGSYYSFPFIRGDQRLLTSAGPVIRKDWLDELGLEVPTTIDEWHTVLTAFKEKKGAVAPLSPYWDMMSVLSWGTFIGAYDITKGFYMDEGQVKYGPVEPGYKEFLTTMNQWFNEKLLDNNFATLDTKTVDANIMNGKSGATVASAGSGVAKWTTTMADQDPKFQVVGAPYPVLNKGDQPQFAQYSLPFTRFGAAISANSANKEAAAAFLDYLYSEEGMLLANFGIEGTSYTIENGSIVFTDLVLKNPDGLPVSQAMAKFTLSHDMGPFIQNPGVSQTMIPAQADAVEVWSSTEVAKHFLPPIFVSEEEQGEMAKIMNEVTTYENEMMLKFIMGTEPISNFDKYIEQLKKLGVEQAISMQQAALERYNNR
ncbi:ABC transporter substrate-binding protein [Paenibacillus agaridevorans]|uniref:ABC transporter substrate-binding protein n=1 Tax=Paenibacillus agaridevorans TaxID=171404 RepID=A0A2R5EZZ8_9BACL|nr:extracellular solute-binding protein [Paenibacillus agaridevorans]GBG11229.1 ABC transporter substrate-binding protein [Paenibacillus agaridevorans]